MGSVTINLYDVREHSGDFLSACSAIERKPPAERDIPINGYPMKMEHLSYLEDKRLVLMDFSKRRMAGPGRSSANALTQGFKLQKTEGFGELTAALYDTATSKILIQYNHYGPRSGSIAEYIGEASLADNRFEFIPTLRENVQAALDTKGYAKNITLAFRRSPVSLEHEAHGASVGSILDAIGGSETDGVAKATVTLQSDKGRYKKMKGFKKWIKSLLSLNEKHPDFLSAATAELSSGADDVSETINFLEAQHKIVLQDLEYDSSRMYPLDGETGRGQKLLEAFREWSRKGVIHRG